MADLTSPPRRGGAALLRLALGGVALAAILSPAIGLAQEDPVAGYSAPVANSVVVPIATAEQALPTWRRGDVRELVAAIDSAKDEGLDPADYGRDRLTAALDAGEGLTLDAVADDAALALARDFWLGRVQDRGRFDWHIERSPYATQALEGQLAKAVAAGRVKEWLRSLLPQDERYATLRDAYADATDPAQRDRLRANLERLRWMPRELGADYVFVNIPSYKLAVVEGGAAVTYYDVVVGAPDTPTPQLALAAQSVVVNPSWNVPQSIIKKNGAGSFSAAKGFSVTRRADGSVAVVQKPGPRNSLGRVKIDMPNPQAIYLHDTNAKGLFARDERALSHGCIRVKQIDALADQLMTDAGGVGGVQEALAADQTQTLRLPKRWPVYLVYLTADAANGKVVSYGDPYGRDAQLLAALDQRGSGMQLAAR